MKNPCICSAGPKPGRQQLLERARRGGCGVDRRLELTPFARLGVDLAPQLDHCWEVAGEEGPPLLRQVGVDEVEDLDAVEGELPARDPGRRQVDHRLEDGEHAPLAQDRDVLAGGVEDPLGDLGELHPVVERERPEQAAIVRTLRSPTRSPPSVRPLEGVPHEV